MYAIVEACGKQFNVTEGSKVKLDKQETEIHKKIKFDSILLLNTDNEIHIGTPYVKGASVTATVINHDRGKKIIVFKKKRRKTFMKKKGHRQDFTEVLIEKISITSARAKKAAVEGTADGA